MTDNNIFSEATDKPCSINREELSNTSAIDCMICKSAVVAEYNAALKQVTLYDFDFYYFSNQKVLHKHPVDERTKNRVLERIRTEKRLLDEVDPNDYHYRAGKEFVQEWQQ